MPARQATSRPAPAGQASRQRGSSPQRPSVTGMPTSSCRSVNTVARRTLGPASGDTNSPVLPIQPRPARVAAVLWAKTPAASQSPDSGRSAVDGGRGADRLVAALRAGPRPARRRRRRAGRSGAGTRLGRRRGRRCSSLPSACGSMRAMSEIAMGRAGARARPGTLAAAPHRSMPARLQHVVDEHPVPHSAHRPAQTPLASNPASVPPRHGDARRRGRGAGVWPGRTGGN